MIQDNGCMSSHTTSQIKIISKICIFFGVTQKEMRIRKVIDAMMDIFINSPYFNKLWDKSKVFHKIISLIIENAQANSGLV